VPQETVNGWVSLVPQQTVYSGRLYTCGVRTVAIELVARVIITPVAYLEGPGF
jgi:hypothetical protein